VQTLTIPFRYAYTLLAVLSSVALATALGFMLISGIRHLLWMRLMGGHQSSLPFWLETGVAAFLTALFWYRILAATFRQRHEARKLEVRIRTRLLPLVSAVPTEIQELAKWYQLDSENPMAFTWGIRRHRIALSRGLIETLDETAQVAVMHHEAAHARMHDPLQQSILLVLADAFGPLGLRALYKRYLVRREILADQAALGACNGDDIPLLSALLAVSGGQGLPGTVASYVGLAGVMEARVEFLETRNLPRVWDADLRYRMLASVMAVVLTIGQGLLVWCH